MKFKLSFLLIMIMLLSAVNAMAATTVILDCNSSTCTKSGGWKNGTQGGYNNVTVLESDGGAVEWSDKTMQGVARISYWVTVDEDGATDSTLQFRTEFTRKTVTIPLNEGNTGWREVGWAQVTGGGVFLTFQGGSDGKAYASAVKIEYLDEAYRSFDNFANGYPEHIIFGTHASIGYKNSVRVNMKSMPKVDDKNAYVSSEAIFRYLGVKVKENSNSVIFKIGDKEFSGNIDADNFKVNGETVDGCLATVYEEKTAINIAAIARCIGKEVYISNKGLVIIANKAVMLDEKTDKKDINNILSVLRNEEM